MFSKLKNRLAENQVVRVFGMGQLCYPKIIEMVGQLNAFDAIWFDQEHAGLSISQIEEAARACRAAGLDSFTRLYATDYATVMRPLEAGSGGVMAAQVRTAQEAANVVAWSKFHPMGERGVNGSGVDGAYGSMKLLDYFAHANQNTFIAIQIEHKDAVTNVDAIASIPGVDLLFIGPADLSQSMGIPGQWDDSQLWDAFEKVATAAEKNGIHWGILPMTPEHAKKCLDMGCKLLSIGFDVWIMQKGMRSFLSAYQELDLISLPFTK